MIRPRRDIPLSGLLVLIALMALGWFFLASPGLSDTQGIHMLALMLGGLGLLLALPIWINFLAAGRILNRLKRGQGVIARWTLRPEAVQEFLALEQGRQPRNAWRPTRQDRQTGAEVIFGAEYVVLGEGLFSLPTAGMQSIRQIGLDQGPPLSVVFHTLAYLPNNDRLIIDKAVWRIPVTDPDAANAAIAHFRATLSGQTVVAPRRWLWRIRLGLALVVICPIGGLIGYQMAQVGPRTDAEMVLPLTLMILGVIGPIGGLIIAAIAWAFHRRQRGG
jgi:hypothetical protein